MLPSLLEAGRRGLLLRLVANGLAQAAAATGLAFVVERALRVANAPVPRVEALWSLGLLALGGLSIVLLRALQRRDAEAFGLSYVHDVRVRVFAHVLTVPVQARGAAIGPMIARLTNDLLGVKNWISYGVSAVAVASICILALLVVMSATDARLALVTAAAIALVLAVVAILSVPLNASVRKARAERGRLASALADRIASRATLVAFARTRTETTTISALSAELTASMTRRGWRSGLVRYSADALVPLAILLLAAMIAVAPLQASPFDDGGSPVAWLFLLGIVLGQLQDLTRATDYWVGYRAAIERIERLLALPGLPDGAGAAPWSDHQAPVLSLMGVTVDPDLPDEDVAPNRARLLDLGSCATPVRRAVFLQLARIGAGVRHEIRLGGRLIETVPEAAYRRLIAASSEDLPLLRGTVGGNLRKCRGPGVDDSRQDEILRLTGLVAPGEGAADVLALKVAGLPPSVAGRVRIARALSRAPRILVAEEDALAHDPALLAALVADCAATRTALILCMSRAGPVTETVGGRAD